MLVISGAPVKDDKMMMIGTVYVAQNVDERLVLVNSLSLRRVSSHTTKQLAFYSHTHGIEAQKTLRRAASKTLQAK